jgi:cytochrome c oxidase subunit 2
MAIAVALLLIVIGSVAFHLVSPWWLTPLASNWKDMDDTLTITLVITGIFFVVINLFVVYTVIRFRHRKGVERAAYVPDNKKLEHWLIGVTTVGIVALLAPGLVVYAAYVNPPADSLVLEVVGQQWQWRYRFQGDGGKLGFSDARFVSGANPFGLDPDDPAGQDDIVVSGNEVHLPIDKPVKVLLRSHDVLHDFFVPQFRARMNIVPGQVSSFWFTPTVKGRYEAMCAQLCGVGHPNMRGTVIVEDAASFQAWLKTQPTFAATRRAPAAPDDGAPAGSPLAMGKSLAQSRGCVACHSLDGSPGAGPTWKGLFGKTETFTDGSTALVDEAFLKNEIKNPASKIVKGFAPIMPKVELPDNEVDALSAYIKSQGAGAQTAPVEKAPR